ncbi:MAG: penicillin acylase family protein [Polymorphobacter sp.]|uniref:penicillin acylase family protein n=1 Tax=Polymorphobacter sp. TaxID=1909290 RepID=UPI003A8AB18B
MRTAAIITLLLATTAASAQTFTAEITRTAHGIPHITAPDHAGIGYGVAYAYAQDNLCLLAEEFTTVAGERSLHFGPANSAVLGFQSVDNVSSDVFFRSAIDIAALKKGWQSAPPAEQALFQGFAAGYNRYLRDLGPDAVPQACRDKPWVRPITVDDLLRLNEKQMLLAGSLAFAPAIANAAPGAERAAIDVPRELGIGSNGWAFGADSTANGRGLVVGNPHFPWFGPARFWQMHTTIPGQLDVMGVGIAGSPFPTLGFNKDVAWTHTVTAARHFTVHALKLAGPTTYLVDGKPEDMQTRTITVPVPAGFTPITRTLYTSRFGPLIVAPAAGLTWSNTTAYALKEANRQNQRGLTTWLGIATARSTADIRRAVETTLGIPWVNTIAADRAGNALLADVTAVPNVPAEKIAACKTPLSDRVAARFILLDGSTSACDWTEAPGTPAPGLMPATDQAVFERRDWVANSNDSYWLTTPKAPATPLSPILGSAETARSLRTRSGLLEIERNLAAAKMTPETAKTMAFANKSLAAELALAPLIALAESDPATTAAATALGGWDQRFDNDSRGAYLFHLIWSKAQTLPGLWKTPFSLSDPVNTPNTLNTEGETGAKLKAIIAEAMAEAAKAKLALDARWGDVQKAPRGDELIPVHGADGIHGVLNVQRSQPAPFGLTPVHGSSYVQVVTFSDTGPIADAVLSYSQSTDPTSPWYADQTRQYAAKQWNRLPFTPAEIEAARVGETLKLSE